MARDLKGKRTILTGASGGIGQALASKLVKAGARVALASRNAGALNDLAARLKGQGGDVLAVPTDVTSADQRKHLAGEQRGRRRDAARRPAGGHRGQL